MNDNQIYEYEFNLKKCENVRMVLPDMKYISYFLSNIKVSSSSPEIDYRKIELKLTGKEPIIIINEAVLYHKTSFDLTNTTISNDIIMTIKNLNSNKELDILNLKVTLTYQRYVGNIIYSNTYVNLTTEPIQQIIDELTKLGRYLTKIIFVSSAKLTLFELKPCCKTTPELFKHYTFFANKDTNEITIDLADEDVDSNLICDLKHYNFIIPNNLDSLGMIVYGFN